MKMTMKTLQRKMALQTVWLIFWWRWPYRGIPNLCLFSSLQMMICANTSSVVLALSFNEWSLFVLLPSSSSSPPPLPPLNLPLNLLSPPSSSPSPSPPSLSLPRWGLPRPLTRVEQLLVPEVSQSLSLSSPPPPLLLLLWPTTTTPSDVSLRFFAEERWLYDTPEVLVLVQEL